jgi:small conductance mechanosensitive channel
MEALYSFFGKNYQQFNHWVIAITVDLIISISILIIGFWLANLSSKAIRKMLIKSNTDESLISFLSSFISLALKVMIVITAVTQFGVQMTSFIAILGAAGLAVGMAFSGTLSNFAGGIMILIFKPFKVGDTILAQNERGVVKEVQIFNTYLHTTDNKVVILPNGPLANGNITNFTKAEIRRVDVIYSVLLSDDIDQARTIILSYIEQEELILKEPNYFIGIGNIQNSMVEIHISVWVNTEDHLNVYYKMNEAIFQQFTLAGFHTISSLKTSSSNQ